MKNVVTTEAKPIKLWLDDLELGAAEQAHNLANLPFTYKHVAIMPDAHQGYGMPIGGVLATKGVVVPNAVGVDIGCGMRATRTNLHMDEIVDRHRKLSLVVEKIKEVIPVGFNHHKDRQEPGPFHPVFDKHGCTYTVCSDQYEPSLRQIGTLGGGNHFIEIQVGGDGHLWVMIHSGSRNLGKKVADHYNNVAKRLNNEWYSSVDPLWDLAFLPITTKEAHEYMAEMQYCVDFAKANRWTMMERIHECFAYVFVNFGFTHAWDVAHNYARWENHGSNVIVHRKGATSAKLGEIGIVPGSQGTCSYIVRGLGNKESFESCSHGAGRRMGRKEARRKLSLENEVSIMDEKGIIHSMSSIDNLDEASGAYKDIDVVMENQKDLVEITEKLTPIAVIKG